MSWKQENTEANEKLYYLGVQILVHILRCANEVQVHMQDVTMVTTGEGGA